MILESWLKFFHILSASIWIGTGSAVALIGLRALRSPDRNVVADFPRTLRYLGLRALMPSVILLIVTGLLMIFDGLQWSFSQPWIQIGLTIYLLAFIVGAVYQSRVGIALDRIIKTPDYNLADVIAMIRRWLRGYSMILLTLIIAVWDMVFKPFS